MDGLVTAAAVVLVAELGDKSQLIAVSLATRGRPTAVLAGIAVGAALVHGVSVMAGAALRSALPADALSIVAGVVFLAFAVASLVVGDNATEAVVAPHRARSLALVAGTAFVVAEIGDKTMLATVALASTGGPLGTWVGATIGTVAADAIAVVVGHRLGRRLPFRAVRIITAASFAVVGVVVLWRALRGS